MFLVKLPSNYFKHLQKLHIQADDSQIMSENFLAKYPKVQIKGKVGGYISGGGPERE